MNIIEKNPEILQSQLGQVNLYREIKERKEPFGPDFTEYIASLRGLRRFQHLERNHLQGIAKAEADDSDSAFRNNSFLGKLAGKEADLLFTKEEKRALAESFIKKNTSIFLTHDTAMLLINQGVLDEPLIEEVVFQTIKGIDYTPLALALLPLAPSITPQQLHDAFIESFNATTDHSKVDMIGVTEGYLSEAEMLTLVKRHFQINPDFYDYYNAEFSKIFSGDSQFEIARIIVEHPKLRLYDDTCMIILNFHKMTPEQRGYLYNHLFDRWEAIMEERKRLLAQFSDDEDDEGDEDVKIQDMFGRGHGLDCIVKDYPIEGRANFALRVLKGANSNLFENSFGKVLDDLDGSGIVELVNDAYKTQDKTRLYRFLMYLGRCAGKTSQEQFLEICRKLFGILPEYFQEDNTYVARVVKEKLGSAFQL